MTVLSVEISNNICINYSFSIPYFIMFFLIILQDEVPSYCQSHKCEHIHTQIYTIHLRNVCIYMCVCIHTCFLPYFHSFITYFTLHICDFLKHQHQLMFQVCTVLVPVCVSASGEERAHCMLYLCSRLWSSLLLVLLHF